MRHRASYALLRWGAPPWRRSAWPLLAGLSSSDSSLTCGRRGCRDGSGLKLLLLGGPELLCIELLDASLELYRGLLRIELLPLA